MKKSNTYGNAIRDSIESPGHRRGTGFGAAAWQYVSARIRELNYPNSV